MTTKTKGETMTTSKKGKTMNSTTTKRMKVTYNGFHGLESHNCIVTINPNRFFVDDPSEQYYRAESYPYIGRIAESASRKFGCHMSDCTCGEGMEENSFLLDEYDLESGSVEIKGNYPSR